MIDMTNRAILAKEIRNSTREVLLERFKDVDRKCKVLINSISTYKSEDTYTQVQMLSEVEYERKMIVDRLIGKVIE